MNCTGIGVCAAAVILGGHWLMAQQAVPATPAQPPAPPPAKHATVLFADGIGFDVAAKLHAAGFDLGAGGPLTWDRVRAYNVVVVSDLGPANADFSLTDANNTAIAALQRFLDAGGGVVFMPRFMQMQTHLPPQRAFLNPLGLDPLFNDLVVDPDTRTVATAWKLPFAHTANFAKHPVTAGLTSLWYPADTRAGAQSHTVPLNFDGAWTAIVRGSPTAATRYLALEQSNLTENKAGAFTGAVPFVAAREVGKGRLLCLGITPEYLFSAVAYTTLEGIVLERGLRQSPSQGLQLVQNALAWLAEPSLTGTAVGGAPHDAKLLVDPRRTVFGKPYPWPAQPTFPAVEPAYPGLIGARTAYSGGKATPEAWAAAAKAKGLAFVVFLEEFSALSKENLEKLKADCKRLTTPEFALIPGFAIDDEVGNHYFYYGVNVAYPARKYLSADGKVFVSCDPEVMPKDPHVKGQLAMTTLNYAYTDSGFRLTAGNYLFTQDAAPFANFFSNYTAVGVITARDGKVIEDATADYLKLADFGQGPLPLVIDRLDDPARIGACGWRTVLRLPANGGPGVAGPLGAQTKLTDYWNYWHFFPDNPTRIYVTSGPEIESWGFTGPRDYEGGSDGDFVWPNNRWQVHARVKAAAGLKEVLVLDGEEPFRRFLPDGKTEFEFTLDLSHDKQHNLILLVTDRQGGRAVGHEQWDRNHRLEEFNCADRNNQLSYGYQTRADGRMLMIGGNQTLASPNKRIDGREISPSGTFKNDPFLGAPAFDGGAGGEPVVFAPLLIRTAAAEIPSPTVSDSRRLFHTMDVHVGEGIGEHRFADGVPSFNVWHSLWRTVPAEQYTVRKRNYFFQVDPDSPLAVFRWELEVTLKQDVPAQRLVAAFIRSAEDRLWAVRGSDGAAYSGLWEETQRSDSRALQLPFSRNAYAALLDSPLGGAAVFPLTDGLEATLALPLRNHVYFALPQAACPQKKGDKARVDLLIVGIPRVTDYTRNLPSPSTEVVERFARDFGLTGNPPAYTLDAATGTVTGQRYILDIDGKAAGAFSGRLSGKLISTLPIAVGGLNNGWSAYLYDRGQKKARPVGVFEGKAWATVRVKGTLDVFVGHPVLADHPAVVVQVTQTGEQAWKTEIHNPTDGPVTTTIRKNPFFDPLKAKPFTREALTIPAGSSVWREW